jgi:NAD(P)-dependent dehydrogenase (short-subunit alcohol dehydrogenase family)
MIINFYKWGIVYIVITGTSRGIGFELTQLALQEGHQVLAVARNPTESPLSGLQSQYPELQILSLDITDKNAHQSLEKALSGWPQVDLLINNAGVFLEDKKVEDFERSFLVNSISPFFLTRSLIPWLKKSSRPMSVQLSSMMGSIGDNSSGGSYSYRASKTALNMLFKSLAVDEKWLICLQLHPGWVQTKMGGQHAPTTVKESAKGLWRVMQTADQSLSGSFMTYQGQTLPW